MNSPDPDTETAELSSDELDEVIAEATPDQDDANTATVENNEAAELSGDELDDIIAEAAPVQEGAETENSDSGEAAEISSDELDEIIAEATPDQEDAETGSADSDETVEASDDEQDEIIAEATTDQEDAESESADDNGTAEISGDELDETMAEAAPDQEGSETESADDDETAGSLDDDLDGILDEALPGHEGAETTGASGNELDDTATEVLPVQDEAKTGNAEKKFWAKRGRWPLLAAGLCAGGLLATIVLWHGPQEPEDDLPKVYRQTIAMAEPLRLEGFVVPLSNDEAFSYLSVSVVLKIQQGVSAEELMEKKGVLRGTIYDILMRESSKTGMLPSLETLKRLIITGVNRELTTGGVIEVYVNQYLAV
ncbi:MAG: hypothetical protein V3S89_07020 [Desulfobacterales bacterium]